MSLPSTTLPPQQQHCPLLTTLPLELRREIYTHLLAFPAPLKLRQVIPGARDLAVLRACRQIHDEALQVLYELNTVVVTRNDFCHRTDAALQTPLRQDQVRHLLLASFSQSIACTLRGGGGRCAVCQPSAQGLFDIFAEMPRLKAVKLDFRRHEAELGGLVRANPGTCGFGQGGCGGDGMGRVLRWERARGLLVDKEVHRKQ